MRDPNPELQHDEQDDIKLMEQQFENHDCHLSPHDGCECQKLARSSPLIAP